MLNSRQRDQRYKRMLGLLTVGSMIAVLIFLSIKQYTANPFKPTYLLTTHVSRADRLGEDTPVTLAGMRIGKLQSLSLTEDNQVALTLELDVRFADKLRQDSRARVMQPLIGSAYIEISPGSPQLPALKADEKLLAEPGSDLNDLIATLPGRLKKLDQSLDNIDAVTADLRRLTGRLAQPGGPLEQTAENGAQAAAKLNRQLDSSALILKQAEQTSFHLNQTLTDLALEAKRIGPVMGQVERTLSHGEALAREMRAHGPLLGQVLEQGNETLLDVDDLVRSAQQSFLLRNNQPPAPAVPQLFPSRGR